MTVARVSQIATEVLRTNNAPKAHVSQITVEVLSANLGIICRLDQIAVEVLRPNADPIAASTARPQVFICT